jgi:hypothetical protein
MTLTPQPSIDWEKVEQALVDWASFVAGCEAIWAEDGGPQPTRTYVELDWLVPPSSVGDDYWDDEADTDTEELMRTREGVRRAVLTVQVHAALKLAGQNAMTIADKLASSLGSDGIVTQYFEPARMAPWEVQPLRKGALPTEDKKFVSRAAFDVVLGLAAGTGEPSETVGYIKSVGVSGTLQDPPETPYSVTASITS